jgi:MATE family multidrug resistance protein
VSVTARQLRDLALRDVLAIAVPIMLSNATVPLVGLVDTAVIGQLGLPHLVGGVAIGATIFSTLYWLFGFLRMGTTGFAAQATGARDDREVVATLLRALVVALFVGLFIIALQVPIRMLFLRLLGGSEAVQAAASDYFSMRIWAAPAGLANLAILGWYIGRGEAMTAFRLQLIINVANIVLAVSLVSIGGYGIKGVGAAALVAEFIGLFAGLLFVKREYLGIGMPIDFGTLLETERYRDMLAVGGDIMIRTACVLAATMIFVAQGARGGDATLAANAVLSSILMVSIYFLDGFAFAAETLVGRAIGAGDRQRFDQAIRLSTAACAVTAIAIAALIYLTGDHVIDRMTTHDEVRRLARIFLFWAALSPLAGIWCFMLDGVFIGATRTRDMRNMMLVSFGIYVAALLVLVPLFGNHGLWAAYTLFFIARTATLLWCFPALRASVKQ